MWPEKTASENGAREFEETRFSLHTNGKCTKALLFWTHSKILPLNSQKPLCIRKGNHVSSDACVALPGNFLSKLMSRRRFMPTQGGRKDSRVIALTFAKNPLALTLLLQAVFHMIQTPGDMILLKRSLVQHWMLKQLAAFKRNTHTHTRQRKKMIQNDAAV